MSDDFFKYGNLYSRYQQGLMDPGDPTGGEREWRLVEVEPGKFENKYVLRQPTDEERHRLAIGLEVLRIAQAIEFRLTFDEFKQLYEMVDGMQAEFQGGAMSNAEYQQSIWQIPEKFAEAKSDQPHYAPTRDESGSPLPDTDDFLSLPDDDQPIAAVKPIQPPPSAMLNPPAKQPEKPSPPPAMPDMPWLAEMAGKTDKQLNAWLQDGKMLSMLHPSAQSMSGDEKFGGHTVNAIQQQPVGQRDQAAIDAWIAAMRAAHANATANANKQAAAAMVSKPAESTVAAPPPPPSPQGALPGMLNAPIEQPDSDGEQSQGGQSAASNGLHMALDAWGVVGDAVLPGSGVVADGLNAMFYLGKAASDPANAGSHLTNAMISGVSMIPFVGDFAKTFKYGPDMLHAGQAARNSAKAGRYGAAAQHVASGLGGVGSIASALMGGGGAGAAGGGGGQGGGGGAGGVNPPAGGGPNPAGGTGQTIGNQTTQNINSVLNTIGGLANRIGPVAIGLGAVVAGFKGLVDWLNKVDQTNKRIIEENRDLAKYNGELAASYANLDRDRILREVKTAEGLSGPMGRLNDAQSRNEQAWEHLTLPFKQVSIEIQTLKTEVSTLMVQALDVLEPIGETIAKIYEVKEDEKKEAAAKNAVELLARDADKRLGERKW